MQKEIIKDLKIKETINNNDNENIIKTTAISENFVNHNTKKNILESDLENPENSKTNEKSDKNLEEDHSLKRIPSCSSLKETRIAQKNEIIPKIFGLRNVGNSCKLFQFFKKIF